MSVAQCMMRNANKVLLAASRSKIGRQAVVRVAPLKTVDVLFTNSPVPSRLEEVAQAAGVELIACLWNKFYKYMTLNIFGKDSIFF